MHTFFNISNLFVFVFFFSLNGKIKFVELSIVYILFIRLPFRYWQFVYFHVRCKILVQPFLPVEINEFQTINQFASVDCIHLGV